MTLYINKNGCIMEVGSTDRTDLAAVELDGDTIDYPFTGWSNARICCYRISVRDGHVTTLAPYINTDLIAVLESQDSRIEQTITELDLQNIMAEQSITDMDLRILGLEAAGA